MAVVESVGHAQDSGEAERLASLRGRKGRAPAAERVRRHVPGMPCDGGCYDITLAVREPFYATPCHDPRTACGVLSRIKRESEIVQQSRRSEQATV